MVILTILTSILALARSALAFPQTHPANHPLNPRTNDAVPCGTYTTYGSPDNYVFNLLPECANTTFTAYASCIDNPVCVACLLFPDPDCSGDPVWIGGPDKVWNSYSELHVNSYYCKTTFP